MNWFDGHLDLAYIADHGRDHSQDPDAKPSSPNEGFVSFPTLRRANVTHAVSTIFVRRKTPEVTGPYCFDTPDEAFAAAQRQIAMHQNWQSQGHISPLQSNTQIENQKSKIENPPSALQYALALEGAAPLRNSDDLPFFLNAGIRIISLAWAEGSIWAGGDQSGGDLTPEGRRLVPLLDQHHIIHDVSHLSERAFWSLLDIAQGPVIASHSNCRTLLTGSKFPERHLSDQQIQALAQRAARGISTLIGINLFARFLIPPDQLTQRRATINDILAHLHHIAQLTGNTSLLALGSDMDSGFGPDLLPQDLQHPEHLARLADALANAHWTSPQIARFQFENWHELLALPI